MSETQDQKGVISAQSSQNGEQENKLDFEEASLEQVFDQLQVDEKGLSSDEAEQRREKYGLNTIEEEKKSALLKLLSYFWGPIPWMIEIAAVLSFIVQHWTDLTIILVLLVFNALVGFFQEYQASNAIEALKKQLALKARVLRDGKWGSFEAKLLVPGDIIKLRLGDIIPADAKLVDGDYLSVDQSALTGESLPVDKSRGDLVYSGSIASQGEMTAVVVATGDQTYFGRTAKLVSGEKEGSHFQKAVLTIGDYLIKLSVFLIVTLIIVQLFRGDQFLTLVQFALILAVASIPVALPAVLSVTMAIGALTLSKMKAIVSRLESVEEMASMDMLCCDKTGTLTKNELKLDEPALFEAVNKEELLVTGGLASREENQDPIDDAVLNGLEDRSVLNSYKQRSFTPFDPVHKRTEATISNNGKGEQFKVSKGAPQVILDLCKPSGEMKEKINEKIDAFAQKGYRTLGVARDTGTGWKFLGLLPLYDPPRDDSAETIKRATEHGIKIKMITGDDLAIAKQIASELNLGVNIQRSERLFKKGNSPDNQTEEIENLDGFAQVFPDHKYKIVKSLQKKGHIVGMTGDGVNDAPALQQADVGIAVSGAADAARSAADLVLTAPGLTVIIKAIEEARKIFERMNSYAIYRITETIRIMLFMVSAMIVFNFYPITAVMIILLALLNDLPIMTIASDHTWLDPKPVRWNMKRVLTVASVLGVVGVISTFGLLFISREIFQVGLEQLQTIIFLKLVVAGHLTLLIARTKKPFYTKPYPSAILFTAILGTQIIAALIAGLGWFIAPIPWSYVGFIWIYALIWMLILDWAKLQTYHNIRQSGKHHRKFLDLLGKSFHSHSIIEIK